MEASALARRARAVEELRHLSIIADRSEGAPAECLSTVAESDNTPAELECDHFSLRGYVDMLQKKDLKLRSHIFHKQPQYDEHHDSSPVFVPNYHRWDCSKCVDKVKVSDHRPTSENVSMEQDETDDGCSISIVRIRSLFPCTQQSSDRLTLSKTAQESNSKCSSPGNKAITAMNVPVAEENVPEALVERSVIETEDLQASPNNIDVPANTLNAASKDVSDLHDDVQMISIIEENGTQNPCSPKPSVAPNEDENNAAQDIPNDDPNESTVCKPDSEQKGKQISGVDKGPRRALLRRNVGSDDKKKKSTELPGTSEFKISQRKRVKMRKLSELIGANQAGVSADAVQVDHTNNVDLREGAKSKMHLEVGKGNDAPNLKVDEIQSRALKDKAKQTGVDKVDDGSSLMNWLKSTHKKVRTEKKDSEHKNLASSAVSSSYSDIAASNGMHHGFLPSVGDVGQEKVPSTTNAKHGNGNLQNDNLEQNMPKADELCQNESRNLKQRFFSNEKSMILLKKRKVLSTSVAHDENIENSTINRDMHRSDDLAQVEPEGSVQRCLSKVSLDKQKIQNVPGLRKKNIPKNKKKGKQEVTEKQNVIDDFPMDIVELLARNQHERQLMTDTNSLENCHTQPKVAEVDCAEVAAKDWPMNASNEFDTNFQKSLDHASSSKQATNMRMQDLHTQKSPQCHATTSTSTSTSTMVPNGHPGVQMQNLLEVHALPITRPFSVHSSKLPVLDIVECSQEQQTQFYRDEEVTIACTSPIFSHHQHIAEVPAQSRRNNGEKKLMWDSFKTASRNSPTSSNGFQFGNRLQEVGSAPIHAYGGSSNYAAHQPVILAVNQPRSVPSTALTMEAGRLYDQRISGQSSLYPKEPMPARHLLRSMDSSTAPGFTNYHQRGNRRQMELPAQILGSQYIQHDQYNASPCTSYGHIAEEVPLTLQDISRRQVQQNLHRPLRPHPRVGVLGSLLQQDIANWSENYGPQSGYRLGDSKGTSLDMNRKGNYTALNSGIFSARGNALQVGSAISVANLESLLPRYGTGQPSTTGNGKTVHPLDKLVRKDICVTNRNPADFTVISDKNEYMRNV